MRLSTTLIILLICLFGLLMIISAVNMHEKESIIMKAIFICHWCFGTDGRRISFDSRSFVKVR